MVTPALTAPVKRARDVHETRAIDLVCDIRNSEGVVGPDGTQPVEITGVQDVSVRPDECPHVIGIAVEDVQRRTSHGERAGLRVHGGEHGCE